jgi:hypothetical protein
MIPWNEEQRDVQCCYEEFKIFVRQVATAQDQINVFEPLGDFRRVEAVYDHIADGKYLQGKLQMYFALKCLYAQGQIGCISCKGWL